MGIVKVECIKNFAYHGCMAVEAEVGTWFETTVSVHGDLSIAAKTDDINDAIDYCAITDIVNEEMETRSNLIEHVAQRIIDALRDRFPLLTEVEVTVKKLNAPVKGEVSSVGVTLNWLTSH
jgi:7,8-dihydroneopterin aldolase/epimerase/oxygenase